MGAVVTDRTRSGACIDRRTRGLIAIACLAIATAMMSPATASKTRATFPLSPTVTLKTIRLDKGPQEVRLLKLGVGTVPDIQPASAQFPLRAKVSTMSAAAGALAGVNSDFGTEQDQPVHTLMIDGELWTTGLLPGSAIAWSNDGSQAYLGKPDVRIGFTSHRKRTPVASWNALQGATTVSAYTARGGSLARPPGTASPVATDPAWCAARLEPLTDLKWNGAAHAAIVRSYSVVEQPEPTPRTPLAIGTKPGAVVLAAGYASGATNRVMALAVGDRVRISWKLVGWPNTIDVMGGSQILVQDGVNVAPAYHSGSPTVLNYNPRTAVGITAGCSDTDPVTGCAMDLITVDGRQTSSGWSQGVRLPALANLLIHAGAWDALNLDGGGSTTMWVKQQGPYCQLFPVVGGCVVNRPATSSSGGERSIRTALVALPGADMGTPPGLR